MSKLASTLFTLIIFFAPLALGSADIYFEAVLQLLVLCLFFVYVVKSTAKGVFEYRATALNIFFLIFAVYPVMQILFGITVYPYATVLSFRSAVFFAMLFIAANGLISDWKKIDGLLFKLTAAGFFVSVIGIAQALTGTPKIYWLVASSNQSFFGPFINENSFACYVSMICLTTLGSIFSSILRWEVSEPGMPVKKVIFDIFNNLLNEKTVFKLFAFSVMAYSVYLSRSRSGMAFFAVSLALFLVFFFRRNKAVIASIILALAGAGLFLNRFGVDTALSRLSTVMAPDAYAGRAVVYEAGLRLFKDYPFFGIGLGAFSNIFPQYNYGKELFSFTHIHNDILQLLIETGAAGFIMIVAPLVLFFAKFISKVFRTSDNYKYCVGLSLLSAFLYLGLHSMTDFQLRINAVSSLAVLLLAISVSLTGLGRPRKAIKINGAPMAAVSYILSVAIFVFSFILILRPVAASVLSNSGDGAKLKLAMRIEPGNGQTYFKYALFILGGLDKGNISKKTALEEAAKALDKAITADPYRSEYLIEKAQLYYMGYDYDKAFDILKAVTLSEPNNPKAYLAYAYMLFWKAIGEFDPQEKARLLKKGLVYYDMAGALSKHTHLSSVIKDKMTYYLLKSSLKAEGIEVQ